MDKNSDLLEEQVAEELEEKVTQLNRDHDFLAAASEIMNSEAGESVKIKKFQDLLASKQVVLDEDNVKVYFDAVNSGYDSAIRLQSEELEEVAAGVDGDYDDVDPEFLREEEKKAKKKAILNMVALIGMGTVAGGLITGLITAKVLDKKKEEKVKKKGKAGFDEGYHSLISPTGRKGRRNSI